MDLNMIQSIPLWGWLLAVWIIPFLGLRLYIRYFEHQSLLDINTFIICLIPIMNMVIFVIILIILCCNFFSEKEVREQAKIKERRERRLERAEIFLRDHGYTWNDVDEFYDSLNVVRRMVESYRNEE